jgi:hypothetical protein
VERACESCTKRFRPHPAVRHQRYCSGEVCQRERKRRWQSYKRATDADYRRNQAAAQRSWCTKNPGYWSQYRKRNPGAAERNREQQRERNWLRRGIRQRPPVSAASERPPAPRPAIAAGRYRLIPVAGVGDGVIAKMDELFVEVVVVPEFAPAAPG